MTNDEIYYNSFPFLLHKVTKNLRYIFLEILRERKDIVVVGYYDIKPSEIEIELLEDISDAIAGMVYEDFSVRISYNISDKIFTLDTNSGYPLFARYHDH